MTDYQLLNQIDELVASKTFNLDALDGIKKLKDDLKKTLEERDALQKRYDVLYETNARQSEELQRQIKRIETLTKDLQESEAYRAKARESIYEAEKHKAVAEAWQGAMAMVFKPNAVRETVQRNVAKPVEGNRGGNGYSPSAGYLATGQESETVTREDA